MTTTEEHCSKEARTETGESSKIDGERRNRKQERQKKLADVKKEKEIRKKSAKGTVTRE